MSPDDDAQKAAAPGLLDSLADFVRGVGLRLLIHLCALALGAIISATLPADMGGVTVILAAYIGCICLVPRGIAKTADWVIPTSFGCLLILVWILWGVPWQFTLIWGGALTWLIRVLMKGGAIDWEWAVLPWLFLALYGFFSSMAPHIPGTPPYLAFPLLAAGGWAALRLHTRLKGDALLKHMLTDAVTRIEGILNKDGAPKELEASLHGLLKRCRRFMELKPRLSKEDAGLVRDLDSLAKKLAKSGASPDAAAAVRKDIAGLNTRLEERLRLLEPPKPEAPLSEGQRTLNARLETHRTSLRQLADKRYTLPADIQAHVDGIARKADAILACMRDDPMDVVPGDRFLARYLKAAHTVVDEYTRLSSQGGSYENVGELLARSRDLLARLDKAFADEHAALLENDAINFTAELNVLDKLLKMDGK